MQLMNTQNGYGFIARLFHTVMAVMVIGQLVVGFWMVGLPAQSKSAIYANHKLGGLMILGLLVLRMFWRLLNQLPDLKNTPLWQIWAARSLHRSFYILMLAMPISGWVMSTAAGYLPKVGEYALAFPFLSQEQVCMGSCMTRSDIASLASNMHYALGVIFILFLTIHISIALYHAYLKDGIFARIFVDRT